MYNLKKETRKVLRDNGWCTSVGLDEALSIWEENKNGLIKLFRNHPNWNEEKKMICFSSDFSRGVDATECENFFSWVTNISREEKIDYSTRLLIEEIFNHKAPLVGQRCADKFNNYSPEFRIRSGQKTTRVINKFLTSLGINKHPDYNKNFARYADALNPLVIKRHTVISLNPIDYLLMSNGNSWKSCHRIWKDDTDYEAGEYCSGTVSYMLDRSSFVFYTVDAAYDGKRIELEPKINRQMFAYMGEKLLQSRLYPQANDGNVAPYVNIRSIVQKVISDCLGVPNLWIKKSFDEMQESIRTEVGSTHYRDYIYNELCNLSILKECRNYDPIEIGHTPIDLWSGDLHDCSEVLVLGEHYTCYKCGKEIEFEEEGQEIGGKVYCTDCLLACEKCS